MKTANNPSLNRDALYAKSKVYIGRGLRAQANGDTEEYQLWASLALELIGKAALAGVHPALIADPGHSHSLFAACGVQLSPEVRTIAAKTVFDRLTHIEKGFDLRHQTFCEQMAIRRNAELHSGESPFSGMSPEAWEREFWGAVEIVLRIQKESLESWLGSEGAKAPTKIIELAEAALEWAVKNRISHCRQDFEKKYPNPKDRAKLIEESKLIPVWKQMLNLKIDGDGFEQNLCPACGVNGILAGSLWTEEVSEEQDAEDPATEWWDETYLVEQFLCPTCIFRVHGRKEIAAANLPEEFEKSEPREREFEPDYGND